MTEQQYTKMIEGMACTYRHDFGLLPKEQQDNIRTYMKQLYHHNIELYVTELENKIKELENKNAQED